jgi:hypothetical protein
MNYMIKIKNKMVSKIKMEIKHTIPKFSSLRVNSVSKVIGRSFKTAKDNVETP